ncbi:MAG: methyltransferase domain-containing protein [Planctomycetota bacterium]|nr:methyltransferase domain-containing protein [Planctomycetota bacterium]
MMEIDFGRHSDDYLTHRPGFPDSFYDRLEAIRPLAELEALDLGTGPGTVALELARRGATVLGVDVAENQIAAARRCAAETGLDRRATFRVGRAEEFHAPDESFDLVIAGQSWWWFEQPRTMDNVKRLLRRGGMLVVASFNYLPRVDPVAKATEKLVLDYNPDWPHAGDDGVYVRYLHQLTEGRRFQLVEQFCYDHDQPFTHESWRGRIRTCHAVGSGALTPGQVEAFDRDLAAMLKRDFPFEPLMVKHRIHAAVVRRPEEERS